MLEDVTGAGMGVNGEEWGTQKLKDIHVIFLMW